MSDSFWSRRFKKAAETQIEALKELKQVWESALERHVTPSPETVLAIQAKYPETTRRQFSPRTKALFDKAAHASAVEVNIVEPGYAPR